MTRVAKNELIKLENSVTECNVIYLPQVGGDDPVRSSVTSPFLSCHTHIHIPSQLGYMLAVPKDEVEGKEELFEKNEMELMVWDPSTSVINKHFV